MRVNSIDRVGCVNNNPGVFCPISCSQLKACKERLALGRRGRHGQELLGESNPVLCKQKKSAEHPTEALVNRDWQNPSKNNCNIDVKSPNPPCQEASKRVGDRRGIQP